MNKPLIVSLIMGMLMVFSGALAKVMTPPPVLNGDKQGRVNLDAIIPGEFDGWKMDLATTVPMVNPDDKNLLNKIYDQTLSRVYVSKEGKQVMLSIAYGRNQSSDMQVHRPEICYATSGFDISDITKSYVDTSIGRIPVMHLVAKRGNRIEPITYWIRLGDSLTRGWFEQKLTALGYGLYGKIPDGLLFRVSSISNNEQDAYGIQQSFLVSLLQAVRSEDKHMFVGQLAP